MTMRNLAARGLGAACFAASWGICLWLRAVMAGPPQEPTLLQAALVLTSFVLSLVGLLLMLNGARMLRWPGPSQPVRDTRTPEPGSISALSLADERAARVDALTRRAIAARAGRKSGL